MSPPTETGGDLYDFEGDSGIWQGPLGPADPVNNTFLRLLGSAICLGIALTAAALWCALPALCRLASATMEALL